MDLATRGLLITASNLRVGWLYEKVEFLKIHMLKSSPLVPLRMWPDLEIRSLKMQLVKRDGVSEPSSNKAAILTKRGWWGQAHAQRESHIKVKRRWGWGFCKPRAIRDGQKPPGAQGEAPDRFSLTGLWANPPGWQFDHRLLASRSLRHKFLFLSPPHCGPLLRQPQKSITNAEASVAWWGSWWGRLRRMCNTRGSTSWGIIPSPPSAH